MNSVGDSSNPGNSQDASMLSTGNSDGISFYLPKGLATTRHPTPKYTTDDDKLSNTMRKMSATTLRPGLYALAKKLDPPIFSHCIFFHFFFFFLNISYHISSIEGINQFLGISDYVPFSNHSSYPDGATTTEAGYGHYASIEVQ